MQITRRHVLTAAIVLVAVLAGLLKYWDYMRNPWTRDGQVQAEVVQITPRVSGPIVKLPIRDNQFVQAGDLLFEIDPRTFQATVDQARADLDKTGDDVQALEKQVEAARASLESARADSARAESYIGQVEATIQERVAEYERQQNLLPQKATSEKALERAKANYEVALQEKRSADAQLLQAVAGRMEAEAALAEAEAKLGALGEDNPQVRAAIATLRQAELNLEFTQVRAPVDGYITNLNLRLGSQAVVNQPALALVDVSSYWVSGFFREDTIANIRPGDRSVVTLMTYPDRPLEAYVDSIGWGIAQHDGSTGESLLPNVNPTFEWIRLAQRIPVRIHLENVPEDIALRVGSTCSVLVKTGTADDGGGGPRADSASRP